MYALILLVLMQPYNPLGLGQASGGQTAPAATGVSGAGEQRQPRRSGSRCVVVTTAAWCGPCRTSKAAIESSRLVWTSRRNVSASVYIFDVSYFPAPSVPYYRLYEDGVLIDERSGVMNAEQLTEFLWKGLR